MMNNTPIIISFLETAKRRWLLMSVIVVLVTGIGVLLIWIQARTYTTSAILLVHSERRGSEFAIDIQTLQTIEHLNETISALAVQPSVLRRVLRLADLPYDEFQLRKRVSAVPIPRTELIRITGNDTSPERAQTIANTTALALTERFEEIEQTRLSGTSIRIAEEAPRPPIPTSTPKRVQAVGVFLFSIFVALIIGRLRDITDPRVLAEEDVTENLSLPIVGKTSLFRRQGTAHILRTRDAFRELQSSLQFLHRVEPERAIAITGMIAGEGKTTTVANLAVAFHDVGQDVIVVDLDFRKPALHRLFQVSNDPAHSMSRVLAEQGNPTPPPLKTSFAHISLYPTGDVPPGDETRLYQSPQFATFIREVLHPHDGASPWLLVDLPPLFAVPGAIAAAAELRNVLIVIELGRPRLKTARESLNLLRRANVNLLGAVLTKLPRPGHGYGAYYGTRSFREGGMRRIREGVG